ncbi:heterokaryon incompatibility protein-domain-containing protein [Aspergillus avenaceus]|uniref:Heterokaryon incompatibility protein-domain-containing protein n=1 Tax=Aspergillus avenaceus TaxID=36643 RepID=A0A5N6TYQ1_ASPAV|nr:heterokaryon incompatibility protein-domain-containing protein [Aspergillus avenaceus]
MSPNSEYSSHTIPPLFRYSPLPPEPYTTRMIRLLPNKDRSAPIQCELFDYDLSEVDGEMHLYQALSYVWGSELKPESIILNGCTFHVTKNLHTALLYLRNRQLERMLWVDAICINQDEGDEGAEKTKQIPLMRAIYAQAQHVIVWLGEATENGDKALETIRRLGEGQDLTNYIFKVPDDDDAYLGLLNRDWFNHIWVLQEVGVARSVYLMCGSVYINGHVFCEGLKRIEIPSNLLSRVGPVAYLIRNALYRPKYKLGSRGSISIAELVGMYQNHRATKQHDKLYALLSLSTDPIAATLQPNYSIPWKEVSTQLLNYMFPECSVESDRAETAVIKGKGWILGHVATVQEKASEFGKQKLLVVFNCKILSMGDINRRGMECEVRAPGVTFYRNNFEGRQIAMSHGRYSMDCLYDVLLTWKIPLGRAESNDKPGNVFALVDTAPEYRNMQAEAGKNQKNVTLIVLDIVISALEQETSQTEGLQQLIRPFGIKHPIIESSTGLVVCEESLEKLSQEHLRYRGNDLPVPEELVIIAAAIGKSYGCIIMELLLKYHGANFLISEEVVKSATGNQGSYGPKILEVLFQHQRDLPVSEETLRVAAGNQGCYGSQILEVLFQYQENLPVSEETLRVAAENQGYGPQILEVLFQYQENLPVSEETLRVAAENQGYGPQILEVLFQHQESLPVSEEAISTAAGNQGGYGPQILEVLFQYQENLPVSEKAVRAAAGNQGSFGPVILEVLFQHQKNLPVSEETLRVAAENQGSYGPEILEVLFQYQRDLPVSEEVIQAAARNTGPCAFEIREALTRYCGASF